MAFAVCGEHGRIVLPWGKQGLTPADRQWRARIEGKRVAPYVACNGSRGLEV